MKNPLNYFDIEHGDSQLCEKCREFFDDAYGVYDYSLNLSSPIFYCEKCALQKQFYKCDKCQELTHLHDLSEQNLCESCEVKNED